MRFIIGAELAAVARLSGRRVTFGRPDPGVAGTTRTEGSMHVRKATGRGAVDALCGTIAP